MKGGEWHEWLKKTVETGGWNPSQLEKMSGGEVGASTWRRLLAGGGNPTQRIRDAVETTLMREREGGDPMVDDLCTGLMVPENVLALIPGSKEYLQMIALALKAQDMDEAMRIMKRLCSIAGEVAEAHFAVKPKKQNHS